MLPNVPRPDDEDEKALADALITALKPVVDEITELVIEVRKDNPGTSNQRFQAEAIQYIVDRLKVAVDEMTSKEGGVVTNSDVLMLLDGFAKKSSVEQRKLLSEMLKNDKAQTELLKVMESSIFDEMLAYMHKLVDLETVGQKDQKAARGELKRFEEERARLAAQQASKSSGRVDMKSLIPEESKMDKLMDFLHRMSSGSLLRDIGALFTDLGLLIGAGGLLSMLPKEVREFVDDFTATFTVIREALKSSWLAPMLNIIEHLPILGSLIRKIPVLNAFFAAFEIIPKMIEGYKVEGWIGAEIGRAHV